MQKWKTSKVKLGLVIDLTNTNRFYDEHIFKEHNVQYQKIRLKGHNQSPTKMQVAAFIEIVDSFFKSESGIFYRDSLHAWIQSYRIHDLQLFSRKNGLGH